jgi:hypothetical protein
MAARAGQFIPLPPSPPPSVPPSCFPLPSPLVPSFPGSLHPQVPYPHPYSHSNPCFPFMPDSPILLFFPHLQSLLLLHLFVNPFSHAFPPVPSSPSPYSHQIVQYSRTSFPPPLFSLFFIPMFFVTSPPSPSPPHFLDWFALLPLSTYTPTSPPPPPTSLPPPPPPPQAAFSSVDPAGARP